MDYIQIGIETDTEAVEALSYFLIDELDAGVEVCDPKDVVTQDKTQVWYDLIDEKLLSKDMDVVIVKAYFNEEIDIEKTITQIKSQLNHISQFLKTGTGNITVLEIPEEKWANEWKKYYKPTLLGKNIIIKPTWEHFINESNKIIVEMDPGMAFGTGTHETTEMCAELLEKYLSNDKAGSLVIDIGTGSGILGIIATKLGAKKVIGVDIDPMAVKVATQNIMLNNVADKMTAVSGNLIEVLDTRADIVVSNIIADIIVSLASEVDSILNENGIWISSGIINTKKEKVVETILNTGWHIIEIEEKNEWIAIVASRKN
ncbi:ribosomal protein L11 methyltransferase [Candidatus Epulonipiscium fishelsonii]|uniref:Ribosomal protein L11 methyltransferase n=1 Tax=Candidatus Epulonipiscium fishelsonii TaxID=77094 RepID=A0ACC8XGP4_9FIRM|nr:ribosomal protein L11 methyltransferase [Epulopiscium sp. SCG-B05WGA-EpuloA1]ONI42778.1 ribosomal protein L11 methyltransferase [Epulopiscium sp. SCG-B11WGA-EpuloA1]